MRAEQVDARVNRAKVEIIADLFVGTVESGAITGFADLHDYVDANGYGGMLDGDPELEALFPDDGTINKSGDNCATVQFAAFANEVQTAIDAWIRSDEFKRIDRLLENPAFRDVQPLANVNGDGYTIEGLTMDSLHCIIRLILMRDDDPA
jgi:hypothetical protein